MNQPPLPPAGEGHPDPAGAQPPAEQGLPAAPTPPPETQSPGPSNLRTRLASARSAAPDWLSRLLADPVGRVVLAVAAIGVCGLGLLVCVNLALLLPGALGGGLPFGRTATPQAAPTDLAAGESLVFSDAVEVPLAVPQTVKFAGQSLPVAVASLDENGTWQLPANQTTTAFWVYGSLVNYVFGLKDTSDNLASIDALAKGDSIEVQMSDGRALRFQVAQKLRVPANETNVFTQTKPGLTLVLAGSREDTRLVIQAAFVGQSGLPATTGGDTVELGTPGQAGDLRVTVTATKLVTFGASELPAGLAYYLVDYVVENTGAGPVEAALVVTELVDPNGSQYAPVIPVSAVTTYPPLAGRVNPNDVINASAAYLVPADFSDAGAIWRFGPGTGELVQINLTSAVTVGPAVNVTLKTATLDEAKTELHLAGTVVNLGLEPIQVTETDLGLISGTGQTSQFVQAEPALPWTLEPSAFLTYEVVFGRPETSAVIFRMLGWEFELTGVQ